LQIDKEFKFGSFIVQENKIIITTAE